MNEEIAVDSNQQAVAKVDLTKYRTGPLIEQLTNLISVPSAFTRIIMATMITAMVTPLIVGYFISTKDMNILMKTGVFGYSVSAGLIFGLNFGMLRVVAIGMRSIEEILNIILRITGQAAIDYENLQTGKARMPTGGELVQQVYDEVVLPTVEKAVGAAFGFISFPLMWIYGRTLGSAVRLVLRAVSSRKLSPEQEQAIESTVESGIGGIAKYSQKINAFTQRAEQVVSRISARIRFFALFPLYAAFTVLVAIGMIPPAIVWYFTRS